MKLPYPSGVPDPSTRAYLTSLIKALGGGGTQQGSVTTTLLLASPNGSVYSVRVGDDGTLSTNLEKSGA